MRIPKSPTALAAVVVASALTAGCGAATRPEMTAPEAASQSSAAPARVTQALAALEKKYDARLGVYALDTGTGRTVGYHADERFAHCSTHKALSAGTLLKRESDARLARVVHYSQDDVLPYSPITSQHVKDGLPLREVIKAALQYSDNTAANLMLARLGGPAGLQRAMRAMGDETTNLDRTEPTLNTVPPGTTRDTSTPRALGTDLRRFLLGHVLSAAHRRTMVTWMRGNTTGDAQIRAGVPKGWAVADKTGSGDYGVTNDIAVAWRPSGAPVVIALLSHRTAKDDEADNALLADATRATLPGLT